MRSKILTAQGFGTLRARPRIEQKVDARGVYGQGSYRVMFRRTLTPTGQGAVALRAGLDGARRLCRLERQRRRSRRQEIGNDLAGFENCKITRFRSSRFNDVERRILNDWNG